ncbi:MAG: membrane protein insertion efficiency factor YidD [Calditrichia bacterium]
MKKLFIWAIKAYQIFISPYTPKTCRFYPSCSSYGVEAFDKHGVVRGGFLTVKRVLKCHPFHPGGFDPVPEKLEESTKWVWIKKPF